MQLIFKYDLDRLKAYAQNAENNITINDENSYFMLAFPGVNYFNFTFNSEDKPFLGSQLKNIKDFYNSYDLKYHRVIVDAQCKESNTILKIDNDYKHTKTIVKTALLPVHLYQQPLMDGLKFVKVDAGNIDTFTKIYLIGFDAHDRDDAIVSQNLINMLEVEHMDMFLVQHDNDYVGINIAYKTETESLLAEGATLPQFRNRGFHKGSLAFRIQQALKHDHSKDIIAWAYKHSISLHNMLKLKMEVQQEFNVYEYYK